MVRDIQKILETIEDNKQKQAASQQELIDALQKLGKQKIFHGYKIIQYLIQNL